MLGDTAKSLRGKVNGSGNVVSSRSPRNRLRCGKLCRGHLAPTGSSQKESILERYEEDLKDRRESHPTIHGIVHCAL